MKPRENVRDIVPSSVTQQSSNDRLTPDRIAVIRGTSKESLFDEIAAETAEQLDGVSVDAILARLWDRERMLSTRLGESVAMPHAQFTDLQRTAVIVALCPDGIEYDVHSNQPVYLVFCIVGDEAAHLSVLSRVASVLQTGGVLEPLVDAARRADVPRAGQLLGSGEPAPGEDDPSRARRWARSRRIWYHAIDLAPQVGARLLILHVSSATAKLYQVPPEFDGEVFVVNPSHSDRFGGTLPHSTGGSGSWLSLTLLHALTEERIRANDVVLNVYGSQDPDLLDTVQVTDVEAAFRLYFSVSRELGLDPSIQRVMLRAVELAVELAQEGREGKPVGALFVLGDTDTVAPHCQQMLMNPFKGYDARHRNILDPGLAETIKELARIDGAFVVTGDGVIESAGTYLRVDVDTPGVPQGLGARHTTAAAITAATDAVAIAVSESTRQVSIFRHGRRSVVM